MRWIDRATKRDPRFTRPQTDVLRVGNQVVDHPLDSGRRADTPPVHGGMIGSTNILLKNPKLRDEVRDRFGCAPSRWKAAASWMPAGRWRRTSWSSVASAF